MFSGLKKLTGALVALTLISCILAVACMVSIYDMTGYMGYRPNLFWIYLIIISMPLLFALTAVAVKKITLEMEIAAEANFQHMKKVESRLRQLEEQNGSAK
jgi:hypothetical protein